MGAVLVLLASLRPAQQLAAQQSVMVVLARGPGRDQMASFDVVAAAGLVPAVAVHTAVILSPVAAAASADAAASPTPGLAGQPLSRQETAPSPCEREHETVA